MGSRRPSVPSATGRAAGGGREQPGAGSGASGLRGLAGRALRAGAWPRARAPPPPPAAAAACPRRCAMQCGEWLGLAEERTVEF